MNKFHFDLHLINNLDIMLLYIIFSSSVVYILLRKHIYSVFDPLFFGMIMGICAYSTVFYLFHFNLISSYYLFSFILTQLLFFVGFILNKPIIKSKYSITDIVKNKDSLALYIYILSSILFIVSQISVYYISGIPMLMESRLEMFTGGSGYGILSRIIYVTSIVSLSFAIYRIYFVEKGILYKLFDYFMVIFSILIAILSGSKAGLLLLIFTMFLSIFFVRKFKDTRSAEKKLNKISIVLLIILFPVAILTLYVQLGFENVNEIFISLALRFIHTGDIFFMSYPNDTLEYLNTKDNGIIALFRSVLGALRLYSWDELPINLGLQVFWYHYDTDLISGPNARHNIFGLFYFGFLGSLIFSFLLGLLFGYIRNTLYRKLKGTESNMILYTLLVMSINYIGQDPSGQTIDYFFSILLMYPLIYLIAFILYQISKKKVKI